MIQFVLFAFQAVVFADGQTGLIDFIDLEIEQVLPLQPLALMGLSLFQRLQGFLVGGVVFLKLGAVLHQPAVMIEKVDMRFRMEQGLVVVLAVDVDQPVADGGQGGDGEVAVVEVGAVFFAAGDDALDDHFAVIHVNAEIGDHRQRLGIVEGEAGFDRGGGGAGADGVGVRAAAQNQVERVEDDRFPRAGFTGQYVKAGMKLDGEVFDNGEVGDPDFLKHEGLSEYCVRWLASSPGIPRCGLGFRDRRRSAATRCPPPVAIRRAP